MKIVFDPNLVLLLIGLGCAYLIHPVLAGVLVTLVVLVALNGPATA